MFGMFSAGRIVNPSTARSQFIGGMTMGVGMALHEKGELDPRFGHVVNHDLAEYHVPVNADITDIEADWLDEKDPQAGPLGARGVGEIGIVGAAAAIANAAFNATGVRVRDLPIFGDAFLPT
jgi:xanthine dehydrogenase YagR molybdenum-binding subunit